MKNRHLIILMIILGITPLCQAQTLSQIEAELSKRKASATTALKHSTSHQNSHTGHSDELSGVCTSLDYSKISPTSLSVKMHYHYLNFGIDIGLKKMIDTIGIGVNINNYDTITSRYTRLSNTTQYGFNFGFYYKYINLSIHCGLLQGNVDQYSYIYDTYTGNHHTSHSNTTGNIGILLTPSLGIYFPIPWTHGHLRLMFSAGYNFVFFNTNLLDDISKAEVNGFRFGIGIAFFLYG